jgi:hypothetical protein
MIEVTVKESGGEHACLIHTHTHAHAHTHTRNMTLVSRRQVYKEHAIEIT